MVSAQSSYLQILNPTIIYFFKFWFSTYCIVTTEKKAPKVKSRHLPLKGTSLITITGLYSPNFTIFHLLVVAVSLS